MINTKRLLSALMVATLVATIFFFAPSEVTVDAAEEILATTDDKVVSAGSTFTLLYEVDASVIPTVSIYTAIVEYDPSVLAYVGIEDVNGRLFMENATSGKLVAGLDGVSDMPTTNGLFKLNMKSLGTTAGSTVVKVAVEQLVTNNVEREGGGFDTSTVTFSSSVAPEAEKDDKTPAVTSGASISASAASGLAGSVAQVDVSISENPGIGGFDITVKYDADQLTVSKSDLVFNDSLGGTPYTSIADGTIHVVWASSANHTGDGNLFGIKFHINDDAEPGSYGITVVPIEVGSFVGGKAVSVPITVSPGSIVVSSNVPGAAVGGSENDISVFFPVFLVLLLISAVLIMVRIRTRA